MHRVFILIMLISSGLSYGSARFEKFQSLMLDNPEAITDVHLEAAFQESLAQIPEKDRAKDLTREKLNFFTAFKKAREAYKQRKLELEASGKLGQLKVFRKKFRAFKNSDAFKEHKSITRAVIKNYRKLSKRQRKLKKRIARKQKKGKDVTDLSKDLANVEKELGIAKQDLKSTKESLHALIQTFDLTKSDLGGLGYAPLSTCLINTNLQGKSAVRWFPLLFENWVYHKCNKVDSLGGTRDDFYMRRATIGVGAHVRGLTDTEGAFAGGFLVCPFGVRNGPHIGAVLNVGAIFFVSADAIIGPSLVCAKLDFGTGLGLSVGLSYVGISAEEVESGAVYKNSNYVRRR